MLDFSELEVFIQSSSYLASILFRNCDFRSFLHGISFGEKFSISIETNFGKTHKRKIESFSECNQMNTIDVYHKVNENELSIPHHSDLLQNTKKILFFRNLFSKKKECVANVKRCLVASDH